MKRLLVTVVAALSFTATTARAQAACDEATGEFAASLKWHPSTPRAGSLFNVVVASGASSSAERARMEGQAAQFLSRAAVTVAGEPLHFQTVGDSVWAIAAVPIDSTSGVTLEVRCDEAPLTSRRIATAAGAYRLERLRVAPRFSARPDSALTARMRREAAEAAEVSRASHTTPAMWAASPFVVPRPSRITSGFGGGRMFNGTVTSRHMGTDYAGPVGAPVVAANQGIVRLVGSFYLGGNVIYIDHGAGLVTAYLHLSEQLVAAGDTVRVGQPIGRVGATGRVTGPHLHFIARYGAITVDPASLMMQTPAKELQRIRVKKLTSRTRAR